MLDINLTIVVLFNHGPRANLGLYFVSERNLMGRKQTAATRAKISSALLDDLTGKVFGNYTVLRRSTRKDYVFPHWECLCICGNIRDVSGSNLRSEASRSCGCERFVKHWARLKPFEMLYRRVMKYAKTKDENWGESNLTYEQFLEFTQYSECSYCAEPVLWTPHSHSPGSLRYNLDRKDSSIGYNKENLVVCCKTCNFAKGNRYTYEEWVSMTDALKRLRKEQNVNARTISA